MVFGESALYSDEGMRIRQATVTIAKNPDGEKNVEVSSKQATSNLPPRSLLPTLLSHTHMPRAATRSL